jgi:LacI family transcriptional regulator
MATIKDVASKAGVSITTVSHVINETRFVSDDLTKRVQQAMEELNFRPNSLAQSLRSGKSKTIGLVIPDISNLFFAEISRKIEDNGFDHRYSVILCNTDDDPEKESIYINVLIEKQVDGIIFISAGGDGENLSENIAREIPMVVADRDIKDIYADIVLVNNKDGGYQATKHLIDLGHKRIGCIAGPSMVTPSGQRLEGYKMALQEARIPFEEKLVTNGDFRYEGGEHAMQELLDLGEPLDAVFVCNDMMALGAMRSINNSGLSIPDDISLIGFDNIPISQSVYPSLSTIAQPIKEMANIIVEMLISRIASIETNKIDNEIGYKRVVMDVELIKRESCRERK